MDGIRRPRIGAALVLTASSLAVASPAFAAPALNTPTGVAAAMASGSSTTVRVSWNDVSRDTGYTVERSLSASSGFAALSPNAPQNAVSYNDAGRTAGTTYFYRVRAFGAKNATSPYSAVVSIKVPAGTDTTPPSPAPTVSFANVTCNSLTVSWTASSDPESGINRYELSRNGGAAAVVSAPSSRMDTGLAPSSTYTYLIKAVNGDGLSAGSSNSVNTPACPTVGTPGDVIWRQAHGGAGADGGRAVADDGGGNIGMPGTFTGTANFGSGPLTSNGQQSDIFIAKYTAAGVPAWSKRYGGGGIDGVYSVAIDRSANCDGTGGTNCIVITGFFSGTSNLGGANFTSAGSYDIFLAKYSSTGAHIWS